MSESCDRCHHSPASHELWGSGPCSARDCSCGKYLAPSPWASDATPEQIERALASLPGRPR